MIVRLLILLIGIATCLASEALVAQENNEATISNDQATPSTPRLEALEKHLEANTGPQGGASDAKPVIQSPSAAIYPEIIPAGLLDEAGQAEMQAALKAYYSYRLAGYDHRKRVFEWQLFSSKLIFGLVILLVGTGVYFSWRQFEAGMGIPRRAKDKSDAAEEVASTNSTDQQTTINISAKGIEVSSSILGVIILTVSMAFLYLYLVYVYPIEDSF